MESIVTIDPKVTKTRSSSKNITKTLRVAPSDILETIEISDPKAKILSEELSNLIGKKIVQMLSSNELTTSEIAAKLDVPIQNVAYHIKRLSEIGIIRVANKELGQRGRAMNRYALSKPSILIVFNPEAEDKEKYLNRLKKIALGRFFKTLLSSILGFIVTSISSYWVLQYSTAWMQEPEIPDPNVTVSPTLISPNLLSFENLVISLIIGLVAGTTVWYLYRMRLSPRILVE